MRRDAPPFDTDRLLLQAPVSRITADSDGAGSHGTHGRHGLPWNSSSY